MDAKIERQARIELVNREMAAILDRWQAQSGKSIPLVDFCTRPLSELAASDVELSKLATFLLGEICGKPPGVRAYLASTVSASPAVFDPRILPDIYDLIGPNRPGSDGIAYYLDLPQCLKNAKSFEGSVGHISQWLISRCEPDLPIGEAHPDLLYGLVRFVGREKALPTLRAQFGNFPLVVAAILRRNRMGGADELILLEAGLADLDSLPGVIHLKTHGEGHAIGVIRREIGMTIKSLRKRTRAG